MLLKWRCGGVTPLATAVTGNSPRPPAANSKPSRIPICSSKINTASIASVAVAPTQPVRTLGFRLHPSPELGLLSILFVLSTAVGAIFSIAIVSIPTMNAFRKLGASANKLSKTVSEEVPGTLASFKLSALEINELTQHLTNLRQKISPSKASKKGRRNNPSSPPLQ